MSALFFTLACILKKHFFTLLNLKMGKYFLLQFWVIIIGLFTTPLIASAQLYPDYQTASKPKPKKQKVLPRFPPQFHSRDTTKAVRDSLAKIQATSKTSTGKLTPKSAAPRTDSFVRIISKKEDVNGNTIIEQETVVGKKKTKQTIIVGGLSLNKAFNPDTINKDSISIQVVKKSHKMFIYHKHKFLTAYKCVFGPNYLEQKQKEGDRRTPEGWFKILEIRPHKEWHTFMLLDYPNEESYKNFAANKANGAIDKNASIGGAVGIHGVWAGADMVVDQKRNWTDGCISLKIADLEQLNKIIKVGTPIFITRATPKKQ
jgi:L,D-peptidoglycan transpeptidase YkuD (ErfK/YbiS/YcfS/YnhG family)